MTAPQTVGKGEVESRQIYFPFDNFIEDKSRVNDIYRFDCGKL